MSSSSGTRQHPGLGIFPPNSSQSLRASWTWTSYQKPAALSEEGNRLFVSNWLDGPGRWFLMLSCWWIAHPSPLGVLFFGYWKGWYQGDFQRNPRDNGSSSSPGGSSSFGLPESFSSWESSRGLPWPKRGWTRKRWRTSIQKLLWMTSMTPPRVPSGWLHWKMQGVLCASPELLLSCFPYTGVPLVGDPWNHPWWYQLEWKWWNSSISPPICYAKFQKKLFSKTMHTRKTNEGPLNKNSGTGRLLPFSFWNEADSFFGSRSTFVGFSGRFHQFHPLTHCCLEFQVGLQTLNFNHEKIHKLFPCGFAQNPCVWSSSFRVFLFSMPQHQTGASTRPAIARSFLFWRLLWLQVWVRFWRPFFAGGWLVGRLVGWLVGWLVGGIWIYPIASMYGI